MVVSKPTAQMSHEKKNSCSIGILIFSWSNIIPRFHPLYRYPEQLVIFVSLLKCVFLVSFVREKDTMEVANRANSTVVEVREGGKETEHINEHMGFTQPNPRKESNWRVY